MRTTPIVVVAALVGLWSGNAGAGLIESKCISTPGGILIQGSIQILEDAQAARRPPCGGVQREVRGPVYEVRPTQLAIDRGLVPPGPMPVTTEVAAFPDEFEEAVDMVEVSGGFLAVNCAAEVGAGAALTWFFEPKIAGASASVEGQPPVFFLQPGRLHPIHGSNSPPIDTFPPVIDVLPRAAFLAPDNSSIIIEVATSHLNTGAGTCMARARVTFQDGS